MKIEDSLGMKFPSVLRAKLLSHEIELPDSTLFEYEPILVYRAVERSTDDYHDITREDFKSYFELGKEPKKIRGINKEEIYKDPHYYGVSSFTDRRIVEQIMKFPNPNKKMAVGYVYKEGGPQDTNLIRQHVCWWLYENADVSQFKLEDK